MAKFRKQRLVVPVDLSQASDAAVDVALEIAPQASHVHVLHVLTPLSMVDLGSEGGHEQDEQRKQRVFELLKNRYQEARFDQMQLAVAFGDPGEEICNFAKVLQADLIVLPSHGRRGLERLLIGSVAERVCRSAPCPVLVLRGPQTAPSQ